MEAAWEDDKCLGGTSREHLPSTGRRAVGRPLCPDRMPTVKHTPILALLPVLALLTACGQGARGAGEPGPSKPAAAPVAPMAVGASGPLVAFLGDSLTAGLGLDEGQAYPALVGERLARSGEPIRVLNAGVSGDTTAGGLRRRPGLLAQHPAAIVVELGANDGLRGTPIEEIEGSLRQIVRRAQAAGARVLIVGMRVPPNYGPDYTGRFAAIYPRLARELDVPLVPFLLEGVGGDPALNQADGIHPTAQGQRLVADNVVPYLRRLLTKAP